MGSGAEWAPAWVSWRYGSGYIEWAPLSPAIAWDRGRLNLGGFEIDKWIPPFWHCFVEESAFFTEPVRDHIVLSGRSEILLKLTTNIINYRAIECQVINRGVDIDRIEKDTGQAISRYKIVDVESRQAECQARVKEDEIAF